MKAMTILTRCRAAEADMRRIRQKIRQRQEAAECITPLLDDTGGGHGGNSEPDRIGTLACAITELEAALQEREKALRVELAAVCVFLDTLDETESAVLHNYYVTRLNVGAIAAKLQYTEGYIRKLKPEAEKKLDLLDDATVRAALPPVVYEGARGGIAMKPPRVCPDCGANLDPQESCDCQKQDEVARLKAALEKKSVQLQEQICAGIRKDARIRELMMELEGAKRRASTW